MQRIEHRACFGGWQDVYRHHSDVLGCDMTVGVYLPPQAEQGPCPVTPATGNLSHSSARRAASVSYWAPSKGRLSHPSSSTPMEKSLQRSRPRHDDTPACQARLSGGTKHTSSPPRRMK